MVRLNRSLLTRGNVSAKVGIAHMLVRSSEFDDATLSAFRDELSCTAEMSAFWNIGVPSDSDSIL